jgi:NAD(P)-dependent dehydrogenase (short-subunit alcohol dehydrogenase family)
LKIQNKTILVTGGGSGLGAATARLLAANGANVVVCDIDQEHGRAVVQSIGDKARFALCNVADEEQVQAAVATALEFGPLNGAVNCAGIGPPSRVVGRKGPHSLDLFKKVLEVNLAGTFNVIRLAAQAMMEGTEPDEDGERGVFITTASVAAFEGQIGQAAYSASKGGIVAMTLPMAREFAKHGIRVMTIAPGLFNTPLLAGLPEEARKSLGTQVPFPSRLGEPDEFAALAKQIFENSMLNGSCIRLDGAIRMQPK